MRVPARIRPHSFHGDLGNESPMVFRASGLWLPMCHPGTVRNDYGRDRGSRRLELLRAAPKAWCVSIGVHLAMRHPSPVIYLCPSIADNSLPDLYVAGPWHGVSAASRFTR